jgi:cell division septal protein FtsQ
VLSEFLTIVVASSCFWGALFGAIWWHNHQQTRRQSDERFVLKRLAARSTTQDRLPLGVLSELLDVNAETPCSVFALHPDAARQRLLTCPAIAQAHVWRLLPGTLGVEYALRPPIATIAGFKNVGIDRYGTLFFLFPFYAPKRLPALVLPIQPVKSLSEAQRAVRLAKETPIAVRLLERIQQVVGPRHIIIDSIDTVHLGEHNVFRREVVVVFSSLLAKDKHLYVRIGSRNIFSALDLLPALCDRLLSGGFRSGTIDLRYERMAILSGEVAQK